MPLLNIDPYITVGRLKEMFHSETGLNLLVKYENKGQDDNTLLGYIGLRGFHFGDKKEHNSLNYDFLLFDYDMSVLTFKHLLIPVYIDDFDILNKNEILPDNAKLSDYIHKDMQYRHISFSPDFVSGINVLNERLITIEKDIFNQWCDLKKSFDIQLNKSGNWINDYEIELQINYYLDSKDPLYDENAENLLITMHRNLCKESWNSMINDGQHHNFKSIGYKLGSPICYLLHDLGEHYHVDSFDIQRIGHIWVDINVTLQHCYDISETSDIEKDKTKTGELFQINKIPSDSMTFENFYLCPENQMAYNISKTSIQSPPDLINPLVIYGKTGTGKTHLLNAIMAKYLDDASYLKIFYTTASEFTSEFINSIMKNTQREFSKKYRALDVLIIDDFEFFEKKEETQNEFYRIMCALLIEKKKVIISSGKNPSKLLTISDRLKSRLKLGYISQLKYPDYESRLGFLSSDIFQPHIEVSDELLQTIAAKITAFGTLKSFITNLKIMQDSGEILTNALIEEEVEKYIQPES